MKKSMNGAYWPPIWNLYAHVFRIMRLTFFLILLGIGSVFADSSYSQNAQLTVHLKNVTIKQLFEEIQNQSEFIFFYKDNQVDINKTIDINFENVTVDQILKQAFENTDLGYKIYDRQIVILSEKKVSPPEIKPEPVKIEQPPKKVIKGVIVDSKGVPIPGATVVPKGSNMGTITDNAGQFSISVADGTVLQFSFIGMKSQEVKVENQTNLKIELIEEAVGVEEVVVVGYGTQKKITITGAISTVSNETLKQAPVSNISTALTGRSPGLVSVQRTGEPGDDATTLRIRGTSTFSGSQEPLIMVDGIEAITYNNIDPNEIESVAILKDASATAVYGVRGANGVLIITTKRGAVGKPKISFTSNFAVNRFNYVRERMDAYDYAYTWNESLKYDSYITGNYVPRWSDSDLQHWKDGDDPIFHPNTDWTEVMLKDYSTQQQQNLNVSGGTDKVKYFISAGMFNQGGLLNNTNLMPDWFDVQTNYKRYNFRSNFDFKVTKRLNIAINFSDQIGQRSGINEDNAGQIIRSITQSPALNNPGPIDGKIVILNPAIAFNGHPVQLMYSRGYRKRYENWLNGSFRINYDLDFITKGLSTHATVSYQNYNMHNLGFSKTPLTYNPFKDAEGNVIFASKTDDTPVNINESVDKYRQTYTEVGLNYSRKFDDHNFTGLLLFNQSKRFDPDLYLMIPSGYQGLVGRVAYDYKGRYLAEFNMGYNGTENFAPDKRYGFFPAYSLGWVLSEESFFPKNEVISFVKFRGSYGEVGNDKIGGSRFLYNPTVYSYKTGAYYFGMAGLTSSAYKGSYEGKMGNPYVTWERAKKADIGLDLNMFNNKLKVTADYFNEERGNILTQPQTTAMIIGAGNNLPTTNLGKMKNSGYDGEISLFLKSGKFNYWFKASYSNSENRIIEMDEVPNPYPYYNKEGQKYGQMYGWVEVEGLYNSWMEVNDAYRPKDTYQNNKIQPGDPRWKDINGDGLFDQYDRGPIGYSNFPEQSYSFSGGGDWKGFDFSFMLQGVMGVTFEGRDEFVWIAKNNQTTNEYLKNSWSQERYDAGLPIYFARYHIGDSVTKTAPERSPDKMGTFGLVDARYIRLRNAEIGYTIKNSIVLKNIGITNFRVYLNGSNLFTYAPFMRKMFPGVDPESIEKVPTYINENPEAYPTTKAVNIGFNLTF
jgi:TonB-linked SusC/RagA family outer membrane protein